MTFAATAVLLGLVCLAAVSIPARRATRVDPLVPFAGNDARLFVKLSTSGLAYPFLTMHSLERDMEQGSPQLLPGTLYMLILRTLAAGPLHGYAIARQSSNVRRTLSTSRKVRSTRR